MKRIVSFVLCLTMLLSLLPVGAFATAAEETTPVTEAAVTEPTISETEATAAEETAEETVEESLPEILSTEETLPEPESAQAEAAQESLAEEEETFLVSEAVTYVPELDLPSQEELFAGYVDSQFYGGIATFGTAGRETLSEDLKLFYDLLKPRLLEIASGKRTSAVIALGDNLGVLNATLPDGTLVYNCPCTPEEETEALRNVELDVQTLLNVLLADFPYELYWFDKVPGVSVLPIETSSGKVCYVFYFTVAQGYRANTASGKKYNVADYEVKAEKTGAAVKAAANARAIVEEFRGCSDYEKLLGYKNKICSLTVYNEEAASSSYSDGYGDPWQMIWVFDGDDKTTVVCEGYSKAYQYLCDQSDFTNDITCYNVVGTMNGGAHMWNIVNVNGDSYLVDVTNCDRGSALFLRGGTASGDTYTFANQKFVYDTKVTTSVWGVEDESILTLATEDLTERTFPSGSDSGNGGSSDSGDSTVRDGAWLVDQLDACTSYKYILTEAVSVDTAVELPESTGGKAAYIEISGTGSITVSNGGRLTMGGIAITAVDGGKVLVEKEGSLIIDAMLEANLGGSIQILGSYSLGEGGSVTTYHPDFIKGIAPEHIRLYRQIAEEALLRELLSCSGYSSYAFEIRNADADGDGNLEPVVLTADTVLPDNCELSIGDELCTATTLKVAKGVTLTNNAEIILCPNARLILGQDAAIAGTGTIYNDGTIISSGSIVNTVIGTPLIQLEDQQWLEELLESAGENGEVTLDRSVLVDSPLDTGTVKLTVSGENACLILGEDAVLNNEHYIYCENGGSILADGGTLFNSGWIDVCDGGTLDMTGGSYVSDGGRLREIHSCDAEGNVTEGSVKGLEIGDVKIVAETYSNEQVIRDTITYASGLIEQAQIPEEEQYSLMTIRFLGDTTLSADLELPVWSDPVITAIGAVTVPEGITLTDHSGMAVYGTLTAAGKVVATGFPFMVGENATLNHPENCFNYYVEGKVLEDITVATSADAAMVGDAIELWIDTVTPVAAQYFGFDAVILEDTTGYARIGWLENGNAYVYSNAPGMVTVEVRPIIGYDAQYNYIYSQHTASVTLRFVELTLYSQEDGPDFFEQGSGEEGGYYYGLYPGNSLHFYANMTHVETDVDTTMEWTWEIPEQAENTVSVTLEDGILTIAADEELTEAVSVPFTVSDPYDIGTMSYQVFLRPKAESVDVALGGSAVTGTTVLFDLNRDGDTVTLAPLSQPEGAAHMGGYQADRKTLLVQWKSSSTSIATVKDGVVTFTGKTGKVTITMTTNFGSKKTAAVTFNVVKLPQQITAASAPDTLIGGSSATYTVHDENGTVLKASAVKWFLCDKDGNPVESHPYASITAAGKLTTKAVADEDVVYLMAQVVGDEKSDYLDEPVAVKLYPNLTSVQIVSQQEPVNGTYFFGLSPYQFGYQVENTELVKGVAWKSSSGSVASIDPSSGTVTVKKPGTAKFTLTVTTLNNKKLTATVTAKFGIFTEDLLLSAQMPGEAEKREELTELIIRSGESITFYGENAPENVTTTGINWSVDNKSYATITAKGKLTAKIVNNPVTVTVTAASKDGRHTEEIEVTILPKTTAVVITNSDGEGITKTTQTLEVGEKLALSAGEEVTWSSSKPAVASVNAEGVVTAHAKGTATITAKTADGRKTTVTVKVTSSEPTITIAAKKKDADYAVASGKYLDLAATVLYTDGTKTTKVTWSVDDPSLATISSSGRLTAAKGLTAAGTVTVYATVEGREEWTESKEVSVLYLTTGVEIHLGETDISNTTLKWDITTQTDSIPLKANTFPEDTMGVTWSSSNAKVAAVDKETGTVTCLKAGTVTITATAKDGSGKKASFKLVLHRTMKENSLQLPETAFIGGGKKLTMTKLNGYAIDSDATNKKLTWTLSYPDGTAVPKTVATLSTAGVLTTKTVKTPVELLVTAAATDGSGETAACAVTVYPVTKAVSLYRLDAETGNLALANSKTVTIPLNESVTFLLDTDNVKGFGYDDDGTADEYLSAKDAWDVVPSVKNAVKWEFDGCAMTVSADGITAGKSVKLTLKAKDGSGKAAYVTVKFTKPQPKEITLKVWAPQADQWTESSWLPVMMEKFEDAHPEYAITWDVEICNEGDVVTRVNEDSVAAADVYFYANDQIGTLIEAGVLAELDGTYLETVKENFAKTHIDLLTYSDGGVYGFPVSLNTWFMWYNKDIFSEEDIRSLNTMLEKGKIAFPMSNSWYTGTFFFGVGGTVFGEQGNDASAGIDFSSDLCTEAAEFMVDFAASENFVNDVDGAGVAGMLDGTVGAMFSGDWDASGLAGLGDKLGCAILPKFTLEDGTEYQMKTFASNKAIGVNPNAAHFDAAMELAAFLSSDEAQTARYELSGYTPAASGAAVNSAVAATLRQQMETATVAQPTLPEMARFWEPVAQFGQNILNKTITRENVAAAMEYLMNQLNP